MKYESQFRIATYSAFAGLTVRHGVVEEKQVLFYFPTPIDDIGGSGKFC